ncbi:MAG: AraC family transcriptional regulator [Chloroflexi bacterium]|nr:AraC family transcriptional regulator [Chloroflexota bacterium]
MTDPLTYALDSLHLSTQVTCRLELSAPWGVAFPAINGGFHVVYRGTCWAQVGDNLVRLVPGDILLLPTGSPHILASDPAMMTKPVTPVEDIVSALGGRFLMDWGNGGEPASVVCGLFGLRGGGNNHPLLAALPALLHITIGSGAARAWLEAILQYLASETESHRAGSESIVGRLTEVLVIQAVRVWIDEQAGGNRGWFKALADPEIGAALGYIHRSPGEPWTVASLASQVGLSRSAFAQRFSELVGEPPHQYLVRWRMRLAADLLTSTQLGLAQIAARLGYESEHHFNRAFKLHFGVAPGAYRKDRQPLPAPEFSPDPVTAESSA